MEVVAAPRLTLAEFQERLDARHPNKFQVLAYTHSQKPVSALCTRCFLDFEVRADSLIKKGCCPHCDGKSAQYKANATSRTEAAAKCPLITPLEPISNGRNHRFRFKCAKHGEFSVRKLGAEARCPRCHKNLPPTHPDRIPKARRDIPCILYLLQIRDKYGYWTKVGISTNMPYRLTNYKREGVTVLRTVREYHTTLYKACCVEMELKRWARRVLGQRPRPRKKWSGWSESFADRRNVFPAAFDVAVSLDKARGS